MCPLKSDLGFKQELQSGWDRLQLIDLGLEKLVVHGYVADLGPKSRDLVVTGVPLLFLQGAHPGLKHAVPPLGHAVRMGRHQMRRPEPCRQRQF